MGEQQITVFGVRVCACVCVCAGCGIPGENFQQWVETACSWKCDCLHSWRASLLRFSSLTLKAKQYRSLTRWAPKLLASIAPPRFHEFCLQEVSLLLNPPALLTSQQVTTKLCTVVYSLGFDAARSGCSQTPKLSPYCRAQQSAPWEMRAGITSSRGHLFKDNKPGLSMLGFYGVVPALKATTGANPAPTQTRSPPFGRFFFVSEFITWEVRWPPPPLSPHLTPTSSPPLLQLRAPRGWDHHFETWLVS